MFTTSGYVLINLLIVIGNPNWISQMLNFLINVSILSKKKYNRKPRLIAWKVVNTCLFKDFKLDIMTRISWWNEDISRCSLAIRCWSDLIWAPNLALALFKSAMLSRTYSLLAVSLPFKPFIMAVILSISCLVLIKSLYMLCRRLLKCSKERIWTSRSLVKFPAMVLARTFIFCLSSWKLEENINISDNKAHPDKASP